MPQPPVYIVHLRRPNQHDPNERRSDPFFEFGSFGCTGCHRGNLMNPKNFVKLAGARLAFAQGGPLGFRLVYLTPPIKPRAWADRMEARWSPAEMPFRYDKAPVLVSNASDGDFPAIEKMARSASRTTLEGGFSSLFRSRCSPLDAATATEMITTYTRLRKAAEPAFIASTYVDALPKAPPLADTARRATLTALVQKLDGRMAVGTTRAAERNCGSTARLRRSC